MGMDVVGIDPSSEVGKYFYRNVWNWNCLWTYCEESHPDVCSDVQYAYSNVGDGLDASDAEQLARGLLSDVNSGAAYEYVTSRNLILSAAKNKICGLCDGTGVRTDEVGIDLGMPQMELNSDQVAKLGRNYGWCNGCRGEGMTNLWEKNGKLEVDDIVEFARFLESSGGFSIQ